MRDPENVDPTNPEPASDATLRLPVGAPADPRRTQQLDLANIISKHQGADSTLKLPLAGVGGASDQTQKRALPRLDEPPIRVQRIDQPVEAAGQTQQLPLRPEAPRPFGWKVPLALGALVVLGASTFLVFSRGPAIQAPPPSGAVAPGTAASSVQVYLEQAKAGDAHAMRMLGVMYFYGLNVPQDREKGLYWYRKAAEKGSDAARSELSKIEGGR